MNSAGITYYARLKVYFQTSQDQETVVPDLEPLYIPEPIGFSFESPAWYVLFALALIVLIFGMWKWYKRYRSRKYRRMAVKKLERIQLTDIPFSESSALSTIRITLKQVAMSTYGRPAVAALFGMEWLQFLEDTGKHTPFTQFTWLVESYSEEPVEQDGSHIEALRDTAKKWIRTHA
jgi:hypothetical protein